jgi:hypothetical protein
MNGYRDEEVNEIIQEYQKLKKKQVEMTPDKSEDEEEGESAYGQREGGPGDGRAGGVGQSGESGMHAVTFGREPLSRDQQRDLQGEALWSYKTWTKDKVRALLPDKKTDIGSQPGFVVASAAAKVHRSESSKKPVSGAKSIGNKLKSNSNKKIVPSKVQNVPVVGHSLKQKKKEETPGTGVAGRFQSKSKPSIQNFKLKQRDFAGVEKSRVTEDQMDSEEVSNVKTVDASINGPRGLAPAKGAFFMGVAGGYGTGNNHTNKSDIVRVKRSELARDLAKPVDEQREKGREVFGRSTYLEIQMKKKEQREDPELRRSRKSVKSVSNQSNGQRSMMNEYVSGDRQGRARGCRAGAGEHVRDVGADQDGD